MALRLSTAGMMTAALLCGGDITGAHAGKPPDLPVQRVIVCQPPFQVTETGSLLFGVGVNSDTGLVGCSVLEPSEACGEVELLKVLPVEVVPADAGTEFTCPYLKQQAMPRPTLVPPLGDITRGVLENLQRLEEAQKLSRRAEQHRRRGQVEQACQCYEEVHRLCPGSRYDHQALNQLRQLEAAKSGEGNTSVGEEQEQVPPPKPKGQRLDKKPDAPSHEDAPASPDGETVLHFAVPLVDPQVVHALHLLRQLCPEGAGSRILLVVDAPTGREKQEQDTRSHNPSDIVERATPNLFLEPVGGEWLFRRNPGDAGTHEAASVTASPMDPNMTNLMRDWIEALQGGTCWDLDISPSQGLRVRCQLQLGPIAYRIVAEHSKPHWVIVYLLYP